MVMTDIPLREFFEIRLSDQTKLLDEWNKRLDERFQAQELAVQFALAEREKSVSAALTAAKEAVNAALIAAKEAVIKAEISSAEASHRLTDQLDKMADVQARIVGAVMLLSVIFPAGASILLYLFTR